jgi:hypothetical protein
MLRYGVRVEDYGGGLACAGGARAGRGSGSRLRSDVVDNTGLEGKIYLIKPNSQELPNSKN